MHNYRELKIWQKSIDLSEDIYQLVKGFPDDEKFGLTSQLKRASVSVASNIAEGTSRRTTVDFSRFLSMSLGSLFEIETQLIIAERIKIISEETCIEYKHKITELIKMIMAFKNHIK